MHKVTLIAGDGIGPSIMDAAVQVLEASGVDFEWDEQVAGTVAFEKLNTPLPDATLASFAANRVAFKGPLTTPIGEGFRSVNVALRQEFNLFANVRPAKSFAGTRTLFHDIDMVTIRENTEGLYSGLEHYIHIEGEKVAAESIALITKAGSQKIIKFAFEYARQNKRKRVTLVHKANILKAASGMFLDAGRELATQYPDIEFTEKIIDACAMQMVMLPEQFDIIVTTNLFGDILSDLAAGLIGGLGLTAGANIGTDAGLFEAVHGSAPDIAGKNIANPTALIMAGVMMLEYLGEFDAARRVEDAVRAVIREGKCVTPDLGPNTKCGTTEMAKEIVRHLQAASR